MVERAFRVSLGKDPALRIGTRSGEGFTKDTYSEYSILFSSLKDFESK
jgi:hypothetical protein